MNKVVIKGKNKKGKNILVISGVHGNELTPIHCTYLLSKEEKVYNRFGDFNKLTIISAVNYFGIVKNTREIPSNGTSDLNRMFNSKDEINLKEEIKNLILNNDVIIDIHSSPKCDEFVLLNQDETTNSYVNFCKKNNIHYLIRYSNGNTIKKYCIDMNKISFTLELNQMDYIDYNSSFNGVEIVLRIINNIKDFDLKLEEPTNEEYVELKTYKTGLFSAKVKCGDIIKKGDLVGYILDLENFEKTPVYNKNPGEYVVICFGVSNYVDPDNSICLLQPI